MQGVDAAYTAAQNCSSQEEDPVLVYVSKMVAVPPGSLPRKPGEAPVALGNEDVFLAFGRVFAGNLKDGQRIHVLSAAYNPATPDAHRQEVQVCMQRPCSP